MTLTLVGNDRSEHQLQEHWGSLLYHRISFAYQAAGIESAEGARIMGAVSDWYDRKVVKMGKEKAFAHAIKLIIEDLSLCMSERGLAPHLNTSQKVSAIDLILVEPELRAVARRAGVLPDLESRSPFVLWSDRDGS